MGTCLAVEVRDRPAQYYNRSGQPRHSVVREKNKPAYWRLGESSLYRPRSRLSIRHGDYRSQDDFRMFDRRQDDYISRYRSPTRAPYPNYRRFEPLPPLVPPAHLVHSDPFRHNDPYRTSNLYQNDGPFRNNAPFQTNNPFQNTHSCNAVTERGSYRPNSRNGVQVIDEPVMIVPQPPRSYRGRLQLDAYSSRRGSHGRRRYDDSDDDSWNERSPRKRYSNDSWAEVYPPLSRRSHARTNRSRTNSRYYY